MDNLVILVSPRNERGKENKKIRKIKRVPAVVYGNEQKNLSFSLDVRDAEKYSKKKYENKIFTFDSEDKNLKGLKVIKKSISRHKASHQPIHMDFLSLDMNKPIRIHVDVHFKGIAKGVKEEGGVFNTILRSIEIECLPNEIPSSIDVDISDLALNQNIHVSDLNLSENIKQITKGQRTLCTVVPAEEEEKEPVKAVSEEVEPQAEGKPAVQEKKETTKKNEKK